MSDEEAPEETPTPLPERSDAWTDLGLTLPVFLAYHLGVVYLPVRNAADPVTSELKGLANQSLPQYAGLTLAIGIVFVLVLLVLGRGHAFKPWRFALIFGEGLLYAFVLRAAGNWVLGSLPLSHTALAHVAATTSDSNSTFAAVIMSFGAGFYEELAFRVVLYGAGAFVIKTMFGRGPTGITLLLGWAVAESLLFSAWHYVGPLADPFEMRSFIYRATCGFVLTLIFAFRGFAPAVWTHALYDLWAMAL